VVFDGPWRRRRRPQYPNEVDQPGYEPYGPGNYPPQFGNPYRRGVRGFGYRNNGSCLRDLLFLDAGCCLAEGLACGPNLLLVAPSAVRRVPADRGGLRQWLLTLIAVYKQEISPRRPACCRFTPTCSTYAAEALQTHGVGRGLWLTARRLLRCRPGATGGDDPVPA
jgi:uncharacterized protein